MKMRYILLALFVIVAGAYSTFGQTEQKVCISQDAANTCYANADKIVALEEAIKVRDKAIEELKLSLARETQKTTDQEATIIRLTALFDSLIKSYTKPKKFGLINF